MSLWTDHLPKSADKIALRMGHDEIARLDTESIQKQFEADKYKVSWDLANFMTYQDSLLKQKRLGQVAKVCHIRAENQRGSAAVVDFMQRNCQHHAGCYDDADAQEDIKKV